MSDRGKPREVSDYPSAEETERAYRAKDLKAAHTTTIAYYCMACPETFEDAATSNAHHDATDHNQTWRQSGSYAERMKR